LVLDDIHIRSVHNLFDFLRADSMFELDEVVGLTALFTRTDAPTFNPSGDNWWEQNYNCKLLLRYAWKGALKRYLPLPLSRVIGRTARRTRSGGPCAVKILAPAGGEQVKQTGTAEGTAILPPGSHLWVLARRKDLEGWWPQGNGPAAVREGGWRVEVRYGEPGDGGYEFEIAALVVSEASHGLLTAWVQRAQTGEVAPLRLPSSRFLLGEDYRTVKKVGVRPGG
jgi:hypothetical protein